MDTNHFFSFSRIAMVMKREIIENWKKNLYAFIGLYAAFALVVVGNMWGMSMNAENAFASPDIFFVRYCTNILGAFIFICLLGSLIYASGILDNMRNKEMRISFLMLPATMLEKYVARFLMATLGFIIAAIVGMLLAEVTRYILLPLFDLPDVFHSSALFKVFSMLTIDGEQAFRGSYAFNMEYMPWLGEACGWSFLIWSHSLYVLGGSLVQESFSQDFGDTDCDFYPWLYYHGTDCGVDRRRRHDGSSRLVGRKLPVDDAEQTACIWRCFL